MSQVRVGSPRIPTRFSYTVQRQSHGIQTLQSTPQALHTYNLLLQAYFQSPELVFVSNHRTWKDHIHASLGTDIIRIQLSAP